MLIFGPRSWPFEHRKTWLGCEVIVKDTKNPVRRDEFKIFKATFFFVERLEKKRSCLNLLITANNFTRPQYLKSIKSAG